MEAMSTSAVTSASAYWSGKRTGRLGAIVLRRSRRHMGHNLPWMQEALGTVIFVVVGVGAVIAVISLFGRARLYDDIGRGGLSIGEDRDLHSGPRGAAAPVSAAEREEDIRQMLEARNARRAAQGRPTVDVERELAELARPSSASDPEILEEVRQLVEARNARRIARGQEPLDVEAEIERQLRDLPG